MAIDLEGANIFDIANRTAWLQENQTNFNHSRSHT